MKKLFMRTKFFLQGTVFYLSYFKLMALGFWKWFILGGSIIFDVTNFFVASKVNKKKKNDKNS